jgi:hypothetical protein
MMHRLSTFRFFLAGCCAAACTAASAQVNPVYSVSAMAADRTYSQGASVTYEPASQGLTVNMGNGAFPPSGLTLATITMDPGVPSSILRGNYMSSDIHALQFEVIGSGFVPGTALVEIRGASGRRWQCNFADQLNDHSGLPAQVRIPLTVSAGWSTPWEGEPHALFAADIQHVTSCSVILIPGQPARLSYQPAQSYTVQNMQLVSDSSVSPLRSALSPLAQALTQRFGYGIHDVGDLTPSMQEVDLDLDSMKDYQEVLAEHDLAFASSLLQLRWGDLQGPLTVCWPAVRGQTYRLMASETIRPLTPPSTPLIEVTPTDTGMVQPTLPAIGENRRYFWLEWDPLGYDD